MIIPFPAVVRFFMQINLVIAGAVALWSLIFLLKAEVGAKHNKTSWVKLTNLLSVIFWPTLLLFLIGWWWSALFIFPTPVYAHEGIVVTPGAAITAGIQANLPGVSLLTVVAAVGFFIKLYRPKVFDSFLFIFYGTVFVLITLILSFTAFSGSLDFTQVLFALHNWHSIITLGTIIVVDALFMLTSKEEALKKVLYPFYPLMSVAIWLGLGTDFISSFMDLRNHGFPETPEFIFNQAVLAVLIMNGALLSVRINDALIALAKGSKKHFSNRMETIVRISGSISIISWLTITTLDFFVFPFTFSQLFVAYLVLIGAVYLLKPTFEKVFTSLLIKKPKVAV